MNSQIITKPTKLQKMLLRAQNEKCFHCLEVMAFKLEPGTPKHRGITREHIFPHATTGKGMLNNIVLAHAGCNGERRDRQPTPYEIAKAAAIYKKIHLKPFVDATTEEGIALMASMARRVA